MAGNVAWFANNAYLQMDGIGVIAALKGVTIEPKFEIVDYQIGSVASRFVLEGGGELLLPVSVQWGIVKTQDEVAKREGRR